MCLVSFSLCLFSSFLYLSRPFPLFFVFFLLIDLSIFLSVFLFHLSLLPFIRYVDSCSDFSLSLFSLFLLLSHHSQPRVTTEGNNKQANKRTPKKKNRSHDLIPSSLLKFNIQEIISRNVNTQKLYLLRLAQQLSGSVDLPLGFLALAPRSGQESFLCCQMLPSQ